MYLSGICFKCLNEKYNTNDNDSPKFNFKYMHPFIFNRYTKSPKTEAVYAFLLVWPANNIVYLRDPRVTSTTTVAMLGHGLPLKWTGAGGRGMNVTLPLLNPATMPCKWVWTLKLEGVKWSNYICSSLQYEASSLFSFFNQILFNISLLPSHSWTLPWCHANGYTPWSCKVIYLHHLQSPGSDSNVFF